MNLLHKLLLVVGLAADTAEDAALSAVAAIKAKADATHPVLPAALAGELGVAATADEAAALSAVRSLKVGDRHATEAMTALQRQVAALSAYIADNEVTGMVDNAIAAKKLLPAQRDWALGLGRKDKAALQGFLDVATVIPGLDGQSGGNDRGGNGGNGTQALSATQQLIAKQLGLDPAKYLAQLQHA